MFTIKNTILFHLSAAVVFLQAGCGEKKQEKVEIVKPVKMITIGAEALDRRVAYPAKVEANRHTDLSFQVGGPIIKVYIKPGEKVKKDQVIAKIDPEDFQNSLEIAEAKLKEAKLVFERYAKLVKSGAVARADYENRVKNYEVAKSDFSIAQKALEDTVLKAPFNGIIARKYVEENTNVKAKQKVFTIQSGKMIDIAVNIPEQDIARARTGMSKEETEKLLDPIATFPVAPNKHFKLRIKEFRDKADPVTQTFKVTFLMPNTKEIVIRPEMTAEVSMKKSYFKTNDDNGFAVPFTAVFINEKGEKCIWKVKKDMTVAETNVKTGETVGNDVIILSGLEKGDTIVTSGANSLEPGMKVRKIEQIGI